MTKTGTALNFFTGKPGQIRSFAGRTIQSCPGFFIHGNWWLTSIVWALMIGALLMYTRSLGACIIAHAVTNLLLAVYVLVYRDWAFW
ncbi:MAG: CPBP family glutamic-type intramembrane protease [Tepidisphaeraceae bacterium]